MQGDKAHEPPSNLFVPLSMEPSFSSPLQPTADANRRRRPIDGCQSTAASASASPDRFIPSRGAIDAGLACFEMAQARELQPQQLDMNASPAKEECALHVQTWGPWPALRPG